MELTKKQIREIQEDALKLIGKNKKRYSAIYSESIPGSESKLKIFHNPEAGRIVVPWQVAQRMAKKPQRGSKFHK